MTILDLYLLSVLVIVSSRQYKNKNNHNSAWQRTKVELEIVHYSEACILHKYNTTQVIVRTMVNHSSNGLKNLLLPTPII
jgi:hypothetical protein